MPDTDASELLTPSQVARLLNVSVDSVRRWAKDGKLQSTRTPGGQRRFLREEVESFLIRPTDPEVAAS